MGFFSAIGSFISGVAGAIFSGIKAVGSALMVVGNALFRGIANLVEGISNFLNPSNKIDEKDYERFSYTAKVKDIKPENYESVSEYIKEVKESMKKLTPEDEIKLENLDKEEKKYFRSDAMATQVQAFAEEIGLKEPIPFGALKGAVEVKMEAKEFKQMAEDYRDGKIPTMDVDKYLENKLNANEDVKMYEYLKEKLNKMNENLSASNEEVKGE